MLQCNAPPRIIHATDRQTFKFCRRKYKYGVVWRLKPAEETFGALWLGTKLHAVLADYYRNQLPGPCQMLDPRKQIDAARVEITTGCYDETKIKETMDLLQSMWDNYRQYAKTNDYWDEVVAVEQNHTIKIPRTRSGLFTFTCDLLVRYRGKLWIVDHKTAGQFRDVESLEWDDQMTAYLWAVSKVYGEMPGGAIYNQIRKKIPSDPKVLLSGKLSKNMSQDTTAEKFIAALAANNQTQDGYEELIAYLRQNPFVWREDVARSPGALKTFERDLSAEYGDMCGKRTKYYPTATRDCMWSCPFKTLCRTESDGGDVDAVIANSYLVKGDNER